MILVIIITIAIALTLYFEHQNAKDDK